MPDAPTPPQTPQQAPNPIDPKVNDKANMDYPEGYTDPLADIESMASGKPSQPIQKQPDPEPDPEPTPDPPKPDEPSPVPPELEFPEIKPTSKAKPLRDAYHKRGETIEQLSTEKKELEAKLAAAEAKLAALGPDKDPAKLLSQISSFEQQLAQKDQALSQKDQRIAEIDYEKSDEFKQQYHQATIDAAADALDAFKEFDVDVDGNPRKGNWDDIMQLIQMAPRAAWEHANSLFGPLAGMAMNHVNSVKAAQNKEKAAVAHYNKNKESILRQRQERLAQEQQAIQQLFASTTEAIVKSKPEWFSDKPADDPDAPVYNERRQKSMAFYQKAFDPSIDIRQRVPYLVTIQESFKNHSNILFENASLKAQLKEAQDALAEYEGSEPSGGRMPPAAPRSKSPEDTPLEEDFDDYVKGLPGNR